MRTLKRLGRCAIAGAWLPRGLPRRSAPDSFTHPRMHCIHHPRPGSHIHMRIRDQEGELGAALDDLSKAVAADTTQLDRAIAEAANLGASAIALRAGRKRKQTLDAERHLKEEVKNLHNARSV